MKDLLLAIDNGTQSLKALVFDLAGDLVAREQEIFQPYFSRQPGWAEQNPDVFWKALCTACQRLWQKPGLRDRIAGVTLTTQRNTLINLDRQGQPLRPAILWLDQRRIYGLSPVGGLWGLLFRLAGVRETIAYFQSEAKINWIRRNQPDIWDQTYKCVLLSGFLTHRLTEQFVDSVGCQVGYMPFDYRRLRWAGARDWKWQALALEPRHLPELRHPAQLLGEITKSASEATGIPHGLPLVAAAADKACEVIGSGSFEPAVAKLQSCRVAE